MSKLPPRKPKTPKEDADILWPHMTQLLLRVVRIETVQDPVFCYIRFVGRMGHTYLWAAPNISHRDAVYEELFKRLGKTNE